MPVRGWFQVDSSAVIYAPHMHTVDKDEWAARPRTCEKDICDEQDRPQLAGFGRRYRRRVGSRGRFHRCQCFSRAGSTGSARAGGGDGNRDGDTNCHRHAPGRCAVSGDRHVADGRGCGSRRRVHTGGDSCRTPGTSYVRHHGGIPPGEGRCDGAAESGWIHRSQYRAATADWLADHSRSQRA